MILSCALAILENNNKNESIKEIIGLEEDNPQPLDTLKLSKSGIVHSLTKRKKIQYYDKWDIKLNKGNLQPLK